MTAFDTAMRGVAKKLLQRLGTTVSVRVVTAGTYSTTDGTATDTTADTTCYANLRAIRHSEVFGQAEITDQMCIVPASQLSAEPRPRDRVVISTYVYDIVEVRTHRAQDQAVLYDLVIRGPMA